MKKVLMSLLVAASLTACNNNGDDAKDVVDSLEKRKDTLLKNVDSTTEAKIDSLKDRSKEQKKKFDSSIDAKKDSVKN